MGPDYTYSNIQQHIHDMLIVEFNLSLNYILRKDHFEQTREQHVHIGTKHEC